MGTQFDAAWDVGCFIECAAKCTEHLVCELRHRLQAPYAVETQLVYAAVVGKSLERTSAHPAETVFPAYAYGKPPFASKRVVCEARCYIVQRSHEGIGPRCKNERVVLGMDVRDPYEAAKKSIWTKTEMLSMACGVEESKRSTSEALGPPSEVYFCSGIAPSA